MVMSSSKIEMMRVLLFLVSIAVLTSAQTNDYDEDCDAAYADSCFTDVQDDIRFAFDPVNNFLQADNDSALMDLCSAWKDSLNCTRDIIDTQCKIEEGRLQFDTWNEGLMRVVSYLCDDGIDNLKAIADTIKCWSIIEFIQCCEDTANLVSVKNLLQTPLNQEECELLNHTFTTCNIKASNRRCIQHAVTSGTLGGAIRSLFDGVTCSAAANVNQQPIQAAFDHGHAAVANLSSANRFLTFVMIIFYGVVNIL